MGPVAWMVAAASVLLSVSAEYEPSGLLFYTLKKINLDWNLTKYQVGCTLDPNSVEPTINSQHLNIYRFSSLSYETTIVNETTIIHEVDLKNNSENMVCGVKHYSCRVQTPSRETFLDTITIYVGKLPPLIKRSEFNCIAHGGGRIICEFQRDNYCDFETKYELFVIDGNDSIKCPLNENGEHISFNGIESEMYFNPEIYEYILFNLTHENIFGTVHAVYNISQNDIMNPVEPKNLNVTHLNNTSVEISWELDITLRNVDRMFLHEFYLRTKYEEIRITAEFFPFNKPLNLTLSGLRTFTDYSLKVRFQIIPMVPRKCREYCWSSWSEVQFVTKMFRPHHAPISAPGAYSLTALEGNNTTIEVFWKEVPQNLHNGPDFEYKVFAESSTGKKYNSSYNKNYMATFLHMQTDENYKVQIYAKNFIGLSPDASVIHIFPRKENYQPKIRKVFFDTNDLSYLLHWFPAYDLNNLINYTIMYRQISSSGPCRDSIEFAVLPPSATNYKIHSNKHLIFAVAANYPNYSTELSWQECLVSSETVVSQPKFTFSDLLENSVILQMDTPCKDKSLIQRFNVSYWPRNNQDSKRFLSFESHVPTVRLVGLMPDTEYEMVVEAIDEQGVVHMKKDVFRTTTEGSILPIIVMLIVGIGLCIAMAITIIWKMMNIKADFPTDLEKEEETNSSVHATVTVEDIELNNAISIENINIQYNMDADPHTPNPDDYDYAYCTSVLRPPADSNQTVESGTQTVTNINGYIMPTEMKIKTSSHESVGSCLFCSVPTAPLDI